MGGTSLLSREQERKKILFQLGNRFGLPKELIIYLYNVLMNSIKHDITMTTNYHRNILSAHLCCPNYIPTDITLTDSKNPFQYRFPLGKGNEWFIRSWINRVDNIMYNGYYNQLQPRDILCQQIKIYGDKNFILKYSGWCVYTRRECYESLEDMDRVKFIDQVGIDLFDHYWDHLEDNAYNLICQGNTYEDRFIDFVED